MIPHPSERILFNVPSYESMAEKISSDLNIPKGECTFARFLNGELHLALDRRVKGARCFVLGSAAPPDSRIVEFTALCHTLKKEGGGPIFAIMPYLAYARHEKEEPLKSRLTGWLGELLKASGVCRLAAVDIHHPGKTDLFPFPVINLSPAELFAAEVRKVGYDQATLVSPDEGAIRRCTDVAYALNGDGKIIWVEKKREEEKVTHQDLNADIKDKAVIIDDILDTGGTLVSCCKKLIKRGAGRIIVMVTHGLFTGEKWKELFDLNVEAIYCTDTVPLRTELKDDGRIKVLSAVSLLENYINEQ